MDEGHSVYNIIYADPPWKYNARNNPDTRFGVGAHHYELMDTGELADLPVYKLAADNCALFLWTTFPRLPDALHVMESWGFDYKTVGFVWVKLNPGREMMDDWPGPAQIGDFYYTHDLMDYASFFGIGYYTKSNPEICLLGVRGRMKPVSNKVSNLVFYKRLKHSAKPDIVR